MLSCKLSKEVYCIYLLMLSENCTFFSLFAGMHYFVYSKVETVLGYPAFHRWLEQSIYAINMELGSWTSYDMTLQSAHRPDQNLYNVNSSGVTGRS